MNLDETLKRLRETDATIFTVGVAEQMFIAQAPGAFGQQMVYIQAQNQLKTFALLTGGAPGCADGCSWISCTRSPPACAISTAWLTRPPTVKRLTASIVKLKWNWSRQTAAR